jgi:hypothetical protein
LTTFSSPSRHEPAIDWRALAIPGFQDFMLPALRLVGDGVEHYGRDVVAPLADEFHLCGRSALSSFPVAAIGFGTVLGGH